MDKNRMNATEKPRKIVPLVYLGLSIGLMYVVDRFIPLAGLSGPFVWGFASSFIALGLTVMLISVSLFKKVGTALIPFHKSTSLVISGPYKLTRNPMYLGMVLVLLGIAFLFGSLLPFFVVPLFIFIIQTKFILGEERFMEDIFGDQYIDYKKRVRRWI